MAFRLHPHFLRLTLQLGALVPLPVLGFVGQGLVRPNAAQGTLEPVPGIAGVASAVMSGTTMPVGAAVCAVAAALAYARVVRPAELRRAAAPLASASVPAAALPVERQAA